MVFVDRLKHGFNAFMNRDPTQYYQTDLGTGRSYRADRTFFTRGTERSIVTSVYNRIALDIAAVDIMHVQLDENGRFLHEIESGLNNCLTVEANIDQSAFAFKMDIAMSMLDEGNIAVCPIDTDTDDLDPEKSEILTMRTGRVVDWYPRHVKVNVYNDRTGEREDLIFEKTEVSLLESPLYAVINQPNSTMQRLIRKLNMLDAVDEQSSSGKLDIIIQLPYVVKSPMRKEQAAKRIADLEDQLRNHKYGIAYTDGTEKITQLNRPVENNLMKQVECLTSMLYGQLGITQSILDGTADEQTMLNYFNRSVEPFLMVISGEMKRTHLSREARKRHESIWYFRDPFKLLTMEKLAQIGDTMTRNEILSSNEMRQILGRKPSSDPAADELRNKNLNPAPSQTPGAETQKETDQNGK